MASGPSEFNYRAARIAVALALCGGIVVAIQQWAWDAFGQAAWERFAHNAEPWVAIGTILLATATFVLAARSRQEASAALQEVEVSRRALEASSRPLLVDAPLLAVSLSAGGDAAAPDLGRPYLRAGVYTRHDEPFGGVTCSIPLQNVGVGVALIQRSELKGVLRDAVWRKAASQSAVPAGQLVTFTFSAEVDPGYAAELDGEFSFGTVEIELTVRYTDLSGGQLTRTRVLVEGEEGRLRPTRIWLYEGESTGPFADLSREITAVTWPDGSAD